MPLMTIFYTSLTMYSALDHAIWLIWHGQVRTRDIAMTQKEAKSHVLIQNCAFEVAIIIVLLSWQFSLHDGEERS